MGKRRWRQFADQQNYSKILATALLAPYPQLLVDSSHNRESLREYSSRIYNFLKLEAPKQISAQYSEVQSYLDNMASLVVHESIMTIINEIPNKIKIVNNRWKRLQNKVVVMITDKNEDDKLFEAYSTKPLSKFFRKELKSGAVVLFVGKGQPFDPESVVFGIIQYGSTSSQPLPVDVMNQSGSTKGGDRLVFFAFEGKSKILVENREIEMFSVASILNLQRQFTATRTMFFDEGIAHEILGNPPKAPGHHCDDHLDPTSFPPCESGESSKEQRDLPDVDLPPLNESQQLASNGFLETTNQRVHIVQGPPGTGKTTMTCATICRYIQNAIVTKKMKRLLVCGPTNKSVVVLTRKVMQCIHRDTSVSAVLIGDRSEFLSDNPDLEQIFAYTFNLYLEKQLQKIGNVKQLYKIGNANGDKVVEIAFERVVKEMKRKLPNADLEGLEKIMEEIHTGFKTNKMTKVNLQKHVKDATSIVKKLDQSAVVRDLLQSSNVIFCTLSTAGSSPMRATEGFDDLIIDEAAACTEAEVLVPLQKRPKRMLLVGDPKQLPAFVLSQQSKDYGMSQSLQERLMYCNKRDYTLLNVQYRMKPAISRWPVRQFYDEQVQDGDNVTSDNYGRRAKLILEGHPYTWVQVMGEEQRTIQGSTFNLNEVQAIFAIIMNWKTKHGLSPEWLACPDRIRVITFYKAQEEKLRLKLNQHMLNVMVTTVDAGQGCEADIVILSFVRGRFGQMGFIKDMQRLNVALTRAKYQLVCVGNLDAIVALTGRGSGGHTVLCGMAQDAKERSHIHRYSQNPSSLVTGLTAKANSKKRKRLGTPPPGKKRKRIGTPLPGKKNKKRRKNKKAK